MQKIVNGLLYDTKAAEIVYVEEDTKRVLYKTLNGNFFTLYANGEIIPKTEESAKQYIGKHSVKKYIELFGEIERA